MDARTVRRACSLVCRHRALLTTTDLANLRAVVVAQPAARAPKHGTDANERAGALTRSAMAILEAEYHRHDLRLPSLASRLAVTHWHLSRVLHQSTGQSFRAHLHQRRVAAAERMLLTLPSSRSIKEIAYEVGYAGTRALDRRFAKATGVTPSEYRRRAVAAVMAAGAGRPRQSRAPVS